MDDAALVGEVQPRQHFDCDVELAFERERIAQRDHVREITPFDQLHRNEELALGFAEVIDGDDVGVLERARGARFADEPLLHVLGFSET